MNRSTWPTATGTPLAILVDLPGPKVRAGRFGDDGAVLHEGDRISFVPGHGASTAARIEVDYERLVNDVEIGDRMMFGDGGIVVDVIDNDAYASTSSTTTTTSSSSTTTTSAR